MPWFKGIYRYMHIHHALMPFTIHALFNLLMVKQWVNAAPSAIFPCGSCHRVSCCLPNHGGSCLLGVPSRISASEFTVFIRCHALCLYMACRNACGQLGLADNSPRGLPCSSAADGMLIISAVRTTIHRMFYGYIMTDIQPWDFDKIFFHGIVCRWRPTRSGSLSDGFG
jgi:hypothetical protein